MEADGEGGVAQQASVEKGSKQPGMEVAGERAVAQQQQALVGKASSLKATTTASWEEDPAHKEKKARKEKTAATVEKKEAGKGDEEEKPKAPASAEKESDGDDKPPASASAGKDGDEHKPPASSVGKDGEDDDEHKPPVSVDKDGDEHKPPASAEKEEGMDDKLLPASEALMEGDNDKVLESAKKETSAEKDKAPAASEEDKAANPAEDVVAPHLPLDTLVADIFSRLSSKAAASCAVLSKGCEERLREKLFLNAHLAPRSFISDEAPNLLVLKPTGRGTLPTGYTHLTLISLESKVVYDMPIRTDGEVYHLYRNPILPQPMVADFFYDTVTELDLSIMACEGRLLFGHSGKHGCFFVCNPIERRFVKLPAPLLDIDTRRAVAAIRYTVGSTGEMREFSVVLLSVLPGPHSCYVVHRFSSGRDGPGHGWAVRQWENEEVRAVVLGVPAPGVYASEMDSFYWINSQTGSIIQYDPKDHRISLIPPPPPETEAYPIHMGWSLGSTAGRLRVSCFSIGPEAEEKPHAQVNLAGLLSVWTRNDKGMWSSVQNISVPVVWMLEFYRGIEFPVDAAQADSHFILVKKNRTLLLRGVEDGEIELLSNLFVNEDPYLHRMYESFSAFFIYL